MDTRQRSNQTSDNRILSKSQNIFSLGPWMRQREFMSYGPKKNPT
jgi:hypothetical protein